MTAPPKTKRKRTVPNILAPGSLIKLREMAHRILMESTNFDEAEAAFIVEARPLKRADVSTENFDGVASEIFFDTAVDRPDVRDRVTSGVLTDPMAGDKTFWRDVDFDAEVRRLGLDKARRKA